MTLMDGFREELVNDPELNELYQRELAKLRLANIVEDISNWYASTALDGLKDCMLQRVIDASLSGPYRITLRIEALADIPEGLPSWGSYLWKL